MTQRIAEFDTWRAGYAGSTVQIVVPGTLTLLSVYLDEAATNPADNPQVLSTLDQDGINYGKFSAPVYVDAAYQLIINSTDETGVVRNPITTLTDEDISAALITAAGGTEARAMEDVLAGLSIDVLNYGEFLPTSNPAYSSSTNAATLAAAVGVAAALGGGHVDIPAGIYRLTTLTVSPHVLICGKGDGVTTLQSITANKVFTLGGDGAGFEDITLDGVVTGASSVGIYSKANDYTRIRRTTVKRFQTGVYCLGGNYNDWDDFYVTECTTGAKLHGDTDASNGANGDVFMHNAWCGYVSSCTTAGVELKFIDAKCWHNALAIGFHDNTGTALKIFGARWVDLDRSWFKDNTTHLQILDGTDTTLQEFNTVVGINMRAGSITGGLMNFAGKCQDVIFDKVEFANGTYTLAGLGNNILVLDCTEASDITLAGSNATKWTRARSILGDGPGSSGLTTSATPAEVWSYTLAAFEIIHVDAVVVAKGRNNGDLAIYHIAGAAARPGSTLAYDNQTANFTLGQILTGGTSGASGRIIADSDSGATGTVTLSDLDGEFVDNETITDALTGSAQANGTLSHQNAGQQGSTTVLETPIETDSAWAIAFGVTAHDFRIMVTGASGKTLEWTVAAKVTTTG